MFDLWNICASHNNIAMENITGGESQGRALSVKWCPEDFNWSWLRISTFLSNNLKQIIRNFFAANFPADNPRDNDNWHSTLAIMHSTKVSRGLEIINNYHQIQFSPEKPKKSFAKIFKCYFCSFMSEAKIFPRWFNEKNHRNLIIHSR